MLFGTKLLLLLNGADAFLTLFWVLHGYADELNPLMAWALNRSPLLFLEVKLLAVACGCALLERHRQRLAIDIAACLYAATLGVHAGLALSLI